MRREETRSKSRQWCPTVTPTRSRNRSNWGVSPISSCSWAATRRRALPWTLLLGRRHAVVWDGRIEEVTSTTCPIIVQAGGGAVADEQRQQSPRLQTCQAGTGDEDAPEPLGYFEVQNLKKNYWNSFWLVYEKTVIFSRVLCHSVYRQCATVCSSDRMPSFISKGSRSQISK